jgi:hypothetical protein
MKPYYEDESVTIYNVIDCNAWMQQKDNADTERVSAGTLYQKSNPALKLGTPKPLNILLNAYATGKNTRTGRAIKLVVSRDAPVLFGDTQPSGTVLSVANPQRNAITLTGTPPTTSQRISLFFADAATWQRMVA